MVACVAVPRPARGSRAARARSTPARTRPRPGSQRQHAADQQDGQAEPDSGRLEGRQERRDEDGAARTRDSAAQAANTPARGAPERRVVKLSTLPSRLGGARLAAGAAPAPAACSASRNQAIVRPSPSVSGTCGSQPISVRMRRDVGAAARRGLRPGRADTRWAPWLPVEGLDHAARSPGWCARRGCPRCRRARRPRRAARPSPPAARRTISST